MERVLATLAFQIIIKPFHLLIDIHIFYYYLIKTIFRKKKMTYNLKLNEYGFVWMNYE